jgi:hypothetical protein
VVLGCKGKFTVRMAGHVVVAAAEGSLFIKRTKYRIYDVTLNLTKGSALRVIKRLASQ